MWRRAQAKRRTKLGKKEVNRRQRMIGRDTLNERRRRYKENRKKKEEGRRKGLGNRAATKRTTDLGLKV